MPALPYGPSTAAIRRFLQRLASLSVAEQAEVVAEYGRRSNTLAYKAAELALGIAISRSGREKERDAVGGPLLQIVRVNPVALTSLDSPDTQANVKFPPPNDESALRPIAEPALAAILALMMADVLPRAQVHELYASFDPRVPLSTLN